MVNHVAMDFSLKYYRTAPFITVVVLLVPSIGWLVDSVIIPLTAGYVKIPTFTAIIMGIMFIYNNWLWKFKPFNALTRMPYLEGRYKGKLTYLIDKKEYLKNCVIEITQSASSIHIRLHTHDANNAVSSSDSYSEDVVIENGICKIHFLYKNHGNALRGLSSHEGCNILQISRDDQGFTSLEGKYFTDRIPQSRGEVKVKFVSRTLKHSY